MLELTTEELRALIRYMTTSGITEDETDAIAEVLRKAQNEIVFREEFRREVVQWKPRRKQKGQPP